MGPAPKGRQDANEKFDKIIREITVARVPWPDPGLNFTLAMDKQLTICLKTILIVRFSVAVLPMRHYESAHMRVMVLLVHYC